MLLFIEGFDAYNSVSDVARKWQSTNGLFNCLLIEGRDDIGQSLQIVTSPTGGGIISPDFGPSANVYIGFAFQNINMNPGAFTLLNFYNGNSSQIQLAFDPGAGVFSFYGGSVLLAVGTIPLSQGIWYFVEVGVTAVASGASFLSLRVNEVTDSPMSYVGTVSTVLVTGTTNVGFSIPAIFFNTSFAIDDFYCLDSTTGLNTSFMGDCKIETLYTTGDSANGYTEWTPAGTPSETNYLAVQSFDKAYVQATYTGVPTIDTYQFDDLQLVATVRGVAMNVFVKNTNGSSNLLNSAIVSGGTEYTGAGSYTVNNVDWLCAQFIAEYDPFTSAQWIQSGVDAAEYGMALTG